MTVKNQREEILRLIAKIRSGSPSAIPGEDKKPITHRLALRRQDLDDLRKKRKQLERGLLDQNALGLYQALIVRIEAIERRLFGAGEESTAALSAAPGVKPAAPAKVAAHPPNDALLHGTIQEGLLADILQLVSSNMMSGVLRVWDEHNEMKLYYSEGEIFHAQGEGIRGESAFYAAMAYEKGYFAFTQTKDLPKEKTIENKTQFLILEALRQMDEAKAQGKGEED